MGQIVADWMRENNVCCLTIKAQTDLSDDQQKIGLHYEYGLLGEGH